MNPPPGVPGVSKNQIFFSHKKMLSFFANIAPKRHKLQKIINIEKNVKTPPCFLSVFRIFFNLGVILAHQSSIGVFSEFRIIRKIINCNLKNSIWVKCSIHFLRGLWIGASLDASIIILCTKFKQVFDQF